MIELKRLKLINWHNFENVTFDCARLTYMIGVNAVGKTTILDAIRYCLTTNRNFNALGNKKSGRTLQGSVHAKQRGENAYRRPGHTVAYIGAEFWDSVKRTPFVIAVRVESEGPMQELHPGDQTWYLSEDGCTLEQLPFIDPKTGAPSAKEDFKPATGRLSYTRSPSEARDRICRALGIGRASSPLGKKFNEVFQMGTSMDEIPNFREFLYQYILPQPELDLDALQGDRLELENLHAVLAEAQTRANALEEIVDFGREAAEKQTQTLVNRGAALLARAAADGSEQTVWQEHLDAGRRQLEQLNARYAEAKNAEAEARRAYLSAHGAASASGEGRALDALTEELSRRKTALDTAARKAEKAESALARTQSLLAVLRRSGFAAGIKAEELTADTLPQLTAWLSAQEKPLEEAYFAARQNTAALHRDQAGKRAELDAVSGGKWVYPHGDAATRVRDAVNAELKSRGMQPDAKIFCELLNVEDESWQDCVEACLGDRRFDILVPPAHYEAAKSAFVALKDKVGPISLLDTPGIRKANRRADKYGPDSLAAQVSSENPLAAQYAQTILGRIVCCDTPDTLEQHPDSATRDLLRHHPFRLERLRTPSGISVWTHAAPAPGRWRPSWKLWGKAPVLPPRQNRT
ncbi:MAG: ATP-binding protein [Faecalibacterium sp.]